MNTRKPLIIEGVEYHRHVARYTLRDGRRRRMVRWAPAPQYAAEAVLRELTARFNPGDVRPDVCITRRDTP